MRQASRFIWLVSSSLALTACAALGYTAAELDPPDRLASNDRTSGNTWLSVGRLHEMRGLTAYDALSFIPAYAVRVNRSPALQFVVLLNNHHVSGLEMLKMIRAEDVQELRLVTESESVESGGVEIIVKTVR